MPEMLASFAQSLAEGLAAAPPPRPTAAEVVPAPPALPVAMQLCLPAAAWDWPTDPNGSVSAPLYEFVSYVPQRADDWGAYAATGVRVSDGYAQFLDALDPGPQVAGAQAALAAAASQTQVLFPNGPLPMPSWTVTQTPQGFVAAVAGRSGLAATIVVDLSPADGSGATGGTLFAVGASGPQQKPVSLGGGEVRRIELQADAWGDIPVRPGPWFQAALVGLFANGPFRGGLARNAFFGASGILRGMITGLRVGLNVSVVATVSEAAATRIVEAAQRAPAIRVGGFLYASAALESGGSGGTRELSLPASAALGATGQPIAPATPVLVGVDVTALG